MLEDTWALFLSHIETASPFEYAMWFKHHRIYFKENQQVELVVPSHYIQERIEARYITAIIQFFQEKCNQTISLHISVDSSLQPPSNRSEQEEAYALARKVPKFSPEPTHVYPLQGVLPELTRERYIEGECNDMASLAAQKVAFQPGEILNPLYIYSDAGLGKTHLLQAIAHTIYNQNPTLRIVYVTSEQFMRDFTQALLNRTKAKFDRHYRGADVLLVDDIQLMEPWKRTQDELTHIYNEFIIYKKQMVFAGDRPPAALHLSHSQLASRLNSGLVVELHPPNRSVRQALLRRMFSDRNISLPTRIETFLLDTFTQNYRDIQAAATKLIFTHELHGHLRFSEDDIHLIVKDLLYKPQVTTYHTVEFIQEEVAQYFHLAVSILKGKKRSASIVKPRQIAMYLTRKYTDLSTKEIGRAYGGRDHSTVLSAVRKIEMELKQSPQLEHIIRELRNRLTLGGL